MTLWARRRFLAACGALPLGSTLPALAQQRPASSPASGASLSPSLIPGHEWNQIYAFDEDDRSLAILDISFYSNRAAMGIGLITERGRAKPASLRTTDAGRTWALEPLKPAALSVQFLDEAAGWIAADNGIYKSTDAGRNWKRVFKNDHLRYVRFADANRGYAAGFEATLLETTDAGKTWNPLPAAAEFKMDKDRTLFNWIELPTPNLGFIVGAYIPPHNFRRRDLPAWMDPPAAMRRRQTPSLTLVLQTIDGGKVWKPMTSSIFGAITRLSFGIRGAGLSLLEFEDSFDYPSEVFLIDLASGKTNRIFRDAERAVTDVLVLPDDTFLLAAVERPGRLRTAPIPGKVHILQGNRDGKWTEMEVDYRAIARRIRFVRSPLGEMLACTDSGIILQLGPPAGRRPRR